MQKARIGEQKREMQGQDISYENFPFFTVKNRNNYDVCVFCTGKKGRLSPAVRKDSPTSFMKRHQLALRKNRLPRRIRRPTSSSLAHEQLLLHRDPGFAEQVALVVDDQGLVAAFVN